MTERLALMDDFTLDDPEPYYQELLAQQPFQDNDTGLWVVARDQDVRAILPDTANYSNRLTLFPHYPLCDEAMAVLGQLQDVPAPTAGGDGEVHDRSRAAIRATFPTSVPKAHRQMGGIVQSKVDELIEGLPSHRQEDGSVDLVGAFSWELPLRVNMDVLGFSPERYEDIKQWSMGQIALTWGRLAPEEQVRCAQGLVNLWQECRGLVAARKKMQDAQQDLPDDMTSLLIQDGRLNDDEVASVILNFAVAGHETTANAIGNAVYHLLSQPNAWQNLVANHTDQAYTSRVVEEELTLNPPIIGWSRVTNRDVEISGVAIPAEQRVLLLIGAANQDTYAYVAPEQRPARRLGDHLSFGFGSAHYCVGAPLARLEMSCALSGLAARYPNPRLAEGFSETRGKYYANLGFRALKRLPVILEPAGEKDDR